MQDMTQTVDDLLTERDKLFAARQDEQALELSRRACGMLFEMFHDSTQGGTLMMLMKLLNCLQGLAVEAFVTGRNGEGLTALGTAIGYAQVGLKHWPSAPPLAEMLHSLLEQEKKIGAKGTVLIRDGSTGDWTWPFSD